MVESFSCSQDLSMGPVVARLERGVPRFSIHSSTLQLFFPVHHNNNNSTDHRLMTIHCNRVENAQLYDF